MIDLASLTYEAEHNLEPEVVQAGRPLPLVQVDEPPAAPAVLVVLPHGLDALLEQAVVTASGQPGGQLNVVVEAPEVFHRAEGDDGALVLLPGPGAVVLEEPEGPGVLKQK